MEAVSRGGSSASLHGAGAFGPRALHRRALHEAPPPGDAPAVAGVALHRRIRPIFAAHGKVGAALWGVHALNARRPCVAGPDPRCPTPDSLLEIVAGQVG